MAFDTLFSPFRVGRKQLHDSEVKTEQTVQTAEIPPFNSGYVEVSGGHEIYYEEWGNKDGIPIMVFHGGPGSSFNYSFKKLFNPIKHRVILFDQRGCGKSRPPGKIEHNTTQDILNDINVLREKLNITGPMNIAGGSWGSTLALLYAIQNPQNVKELVLWSTFLGTKRESAEVIDEHPHNPDFPYKSQFEKLRALIPEDRQSSMKEMFTYCMEVFLSDDVGKAKKLAVAFNVFDMATCAPDTFDEDAVRAEAENDPHVIHSAKIQMHYFLNDMFLEENFILKNISAITHIKATVVHGERDWCTRPQASIDLYRAYGENMELQIAHSGHIRSDKDMTRRLQAISDTLT